MRRTDLWAELIALTPEERIEIAQDLWSSITEQDLPPLTDEQKEELDRRWAEHLKDPSRAITWEELKVRLQAGCK